MRKQVAVDLELVQLAFEDRDGEGSWFLDTENGDAVRVDEYFGDHDELRERIDDGLGVRFIRIPYQGPGAGYRDMEEFASSVTDDQLRALLEVAIRGKGAFRRFKLDTSQAALPTRPIPRRLFFDLGADDSAATPESPEKRR